MSPEPSPPPAELAAKHAELAAKRAELSRARQAVQARLFALAGVGLFLRALALQLPWALGVYLALGAWLAVRWIRGYRRLKAELGLAQEYDELDENAAWSGKLIVVLLGVILVFGLLFFGLLSATRKH